MSYTTDQLTRALQPCADLFNVLLQPIYDDRVLHLYINRPAELAADCPELMLALKRQIARQFPEVRVLHLYSRVWGDETTDWETHVKMPQPKAPRPPTPHRTETNPVPHRTETTRTKSDRASDRSEHRTNRIPHRTDATPHQERIRSQNNSRPAHPTPSRTHRSPMPRSVHQPQTATASDRAPSPELHPKPKPEKAASEPEEFVLHKFCFSRNRRLVEDPLKNPEPDMAESIKFFHNLDETEKRQLLPLLENWLKAPETVDIRALPEATQAWLRKTNSNPQQLRSTGVWLSRYCFDPENAMEQVNATFAGIAEAEAAYDKQVKEAEVFHPDSHDDSSSGWISVGQSTPARGQSFSKGSSSKTGPSQRFTRDELIPLGGTLVAIVVLGVMLSGLVRVMGGVGLLVAVCAIGSGLSYTTGNNLLRGFFSFILLVISTFWWIFGGIFFFIIGGVDLLGWLIGAIIGVSITTVAKQSEAPSIFSPKPLRMAAVLTLGLLLTLTPALFSGGGTDGNGALNVNSQNAGKGRALTTHVASGTVAGEGKTFEFKGAAAIWDAARKELRISLLPVPVTEGDIKTIQGYLKAESASGASDFADRYIGDFPARYLAKARPSHKPQQFAEMPAVQFDILFAENATTFTTETLSAFRFILFWEGEPTGISFGGAVSSELQILKFEPKEGGTLSLVARPTDVDSPFSDEEMRINLKVNTKVELRES